MHAHTFASASVPNTPGRSVLAYRPQLEPMAFVRVAVILRVVVTWGEGEGGKESLQHCINVSVSHEVIPYHSTSSVACTIEGTQGWLLDGPHSIPPSHMYVHKCTGTRTHCTFALT